MSPEAIEAFTEETGVEVDYQVYESSEELRALLESAPGMHDVVVADEVAVAKLADLRLLENLDHNQIANLPTLDSRFMGLPHDPKNEYSIPYLWGSSAVAYRSDLIQIDDESWNIFWDARVRGKAVMVDEMQDVFAVGLLYNGKSLNSRRQDHLSQAIDSITEATRRCALEFGNPYDTVDRLFDGDIWVMHTYSSDAVWAAEEDDRISYYIPKEGSRLFVDNFSIPRESTNKDLAYKFIDFMLNGGIAAQNCSYTLSGTPSTTAKAYLREDLLRNKVMFPSLDSCEFISIVTAEFEETMQRGMQQFLLTSREAQEELNGEVLSETVTQVESAE